MRTLSLQIFLFRMPVSEETDVITSSGTRTSLCLTKDDARRLNPSYIKVVSFVSVVPLLSAARSWSMSRSAMASHGAPSEVPVAFSSELFLTDSSSCAGHTMIAPLQASNRHASLTQTTASSCFLTMAFERSHLVLCFVQLHDFLTATGSVYICSVKPYLYL